MSTGTEGRGLSECEAPGCAERATVQGTYDGHPMGLCESHAATSSSFLPDPPCRCRPRPDGDAPAEPVVDCPVHGQQVGPGRVRSP